MMQILIDYGVWLVTGALMLTGLVGTFLPVLPGHLLIFIAAWVPWFARGDHGGLEWWSFVVLAFGVVLAQAAEFLGGAVGSKRFGGSRWGSFGAVAGGLVGLFFMPFGLLLGPLCGAFLCEWIFAKKQSREAAVSGVGSVLGALGGAVVSFVIALAMVVYLVADIFWIGGGI